MGTPLEGLELRAVTQKEALVMIGMGYQGGEFQIYVEVSSLTKMRTVSSLQNAIYILNTSVVAQSSNVQRSLTI